MEDVEERRRRKGRWIEDVENMKDDRCREEEAREGGRTDGRCREDGKQQM